MINSQLNSDDREERLKQIRERNKARRDLLSIRGSYDLQTGVWDIDFLLSLLDSQAGAPVSDFEEEASRLRKLCVSDDHTWEFREDEIAMTLSRVETAMRRKCVEGVKARLREVIARAEYAHYTELADLNPRRAALEEIQADLESLTLDQEEQKQTP